MIEYASDEERYFSWWLDEVLEAGFINRVKYQPKPFVITESVKYRWFKQLKSKQKAIDSELFRKHEYQADWLIIWENKAKDLFFGYLNDLTLEAKKEDYPFLAHYNKATHYYYSIVDVKGTFNQNDAYRRFSIDQKLVWDKYQKYIQKIIPAPAVSKSGKLTPAGALFVKTFMPDNYRFTPTGKYRKIRFPVRTLNEFLNQKT